MVETDAFYVRFWVWPKDGQIGVNIDNLQVVPKCGKTDSFYVRFRVWPKYGQIGVNINKLQVVPNCGRSWLIVCKI